MFFFRTELIDISIKGNQSKPSGVVLFEFVKKYFENQINSNSRTIHPIYLQHDGHSRTIVGIEEGVDHGLSLIIFDPSTRRNQIEKFRQAKYKNLSLFKRGVGVFNKKKEK